MARFDKQKLKPLLICLSRSWGGLEKVVASDCVDLKAQGCDVTALCLESSPITDYLKGRVTVETIPGIKRNILDFTLHRRLRELYRKYDINVLHLHQPNLLGTIVPSLSGFKRMALVVSRHILNNHNKRDPFHSLLYNRVDYMTVISKTMRENVVATHPLPGKRVKVINLGLDFSRFDPAQYDHHAIRSGYGVQSDDVLIGMVGRIDPAKGQDVFLKAAAQVKELGYRVKFIVVGEETINDPAAKVYRLELDRVISDFRLEKDVIFTGYIENIPEVVSAMDIVVMPSREEAFGLVAIESMIMEKPVIISRNGSGREIAGGGEFALLMRPQDAFDLKRQIALLLKDRELRHRLGSKGRQFVLDHYNKTDRMNKTIDIYVRGLRKRLLRFPL